MQQLIPNLDNFVQKQKIVISFDWILGVSFGYCVIPKFITPV